MIVTRNFYGNESNFCREWFRNFLNNAGIKCRINENHDLLINDKEKTDLQFSTEFNRYGDLRIDFISMFYPDTPRENKNFVYDSSQDLIENFQKKYNCAVTKPGKIFFPDENKFTCVLFYDFEFLKASPNYFLMINTGILRNYIFSCPKILDMVKFPRKENLGDEHGSAFLCLDIVPLIRNTGCVFTRFPFENVEKKLQSYIQSKKGSDYASKKHMDKSGT